MGKENGNISSTYRRFKPHMLMVFVQIGYGLMYFMTEASFNHGMNPHVYVTYRHIVASLVMFPFAYYLERKVRPKLTLALLAEIFVLSLFGVGLTLNVYFASFRYASPTYIASVFNAVSAITFSIAVLLRLEAVNIRSPRGLAKVIGTLFSFAGVMIMTLYKGSVLPNISHPLIQIQRNRTIHENWVKGSVLTVGSCIMWSIWYIMQAYTLKRYPAPLSLTSLMSLIGTAQSAVYTLCVQHKPAVWKIGFNIDLWSTIYAGVLCSGLIVFLQFWCVEEKGPVFVSMFNPLVTVLVAIIAYFILNEKLYLGSLIGAIIVILALYLFLWGNEVDKAQEIPSNPDVNDEETGDCKSKP